MNRTDGAGNMWRLSSSFIAWRKMWASRVRGGQRRSAKWKALLESCRRKIDTGRLYTTQFLSSSFSSPFFFLILRPFSFSPPPYLSLSFFPLLFDCVSRIASWPFVRYRNLLRASLRSPIFLRSLLEYRWPNSHETSHCRINWNCQPNSRTIFFLSFRKFPSRDSSNNFVTRILSDLNSCWKSIVLIIIHCYSYS